MSRVSLVLPEEEEDKDNGGETVGGTEKGKALKSKLRPDWVDPDEIRRIEEEMGRRLAGKAEESENDDEEVDEGEMRKVVLGRVGGWVDWAVGWMEGRENEEEDEGNDAAENARQNRKGKRNREMKGDVVDNLVIETLPPPPSTAGAGMLDDAKWLLGVAKQVAL